MNRILQLPKRLLVGRPIRTELMGDQLLPKKLALPVFCSDPLSSNAYATEEILLMLSLGGLALVHLTWWVAAAVILLLRSCSPTTTSPHRSTPCSWSNATA